MKFIQLVKKNKLLFFVALVYGILFIATPGTAVKAVDNSVFYLIEMLEVLPVIFLFTVVIEAWAPKELIIRGFGEKSGIKGNLLSLLLGSISAGPIYAAFPISKTLLGKGASITNIVIILSAWAVIKVPMLANEVKFLGLEFMAVRWILTVISILAMAYLTAAIVKRKDLPSEKTEDGAAALHVIPAYCIGCGLCAKSMPRCFEMVDNIAVVSSVADCTSKPDTLQQVVRDCPTGAIAYESEETTGLEDGH